MTHKYRVQGMTCSACAAKVKKALLAVPQINSADIDLAKKEAVVGMDRHVGVDVLNAAVQKSGVYRLSEGAAMDSRLASLKESALKVKPLLIILAAIFGLTIIMQLIRGYFDLLELMSDFMGFFFIIFGAFKIINWKGFAETYRTYDLLAERSWAYAYVYPLIELGLGLAYLTRFNLTATNWVTLIVMTVSSMGVSQALIAKRQIACACLGNVFKIPMTRVTLIEDVLMAVMAAFMLMMY